MEWLLQQGSQESEVEMKLFFSVPFSVTLQLLQCCIYDFLETNEKELQLKEQKTTIQFSFPLYSAATHVG